MRAEDFLKILRTAMPSREELLRYGLAPEEIQGIQAIFQPVPKPQAEEAPAITGEIGRLVSCYDCKEIEVAGVHFDRAITVKSSGFKFGGCEADSLVVTGAGTVVMFDHAVESAAPMICAEAPDRFLDALAILLQITSEKDKWKGRGAQVARQCHSAAGQASSLGFYTAMCGFLDG